MRVIADRHAGIAEMDDEQRHEQPDRQQRRLHEQRLGRMEQHVEAADQQRQHQRHEGEPAARPAMGELVADQADDRILDGVDDARGDEDQAHDAERHLEHLAVEVADVQHHRQGRHVERQLVGGVGDQTAERQPHGRGGRSGPGHRRMHANFAFLFAPLSAPCLVTVIYVGSGPAIRPSGRSRSPRRNRRDSSATCGETARRSPFSPPGRRPGRSGPARSPGYAHNPARNCRARRPSGRPGGTARAGWCGDSSMPPGKT